MIRVLFCLVLLAVPARAEMPAGHDDPRFQTAVEAWLDADDQTSLPALAALSREGNTAAQILLSQIEFRLVLPDSWVGRHSRAERKALFRAPGGLFGQRWLKIAAETSPLARALYEMSMGSVELEEIERLLDLGEHSRAHVFTNMIVSQGYTLELIEMVHGRTDAPYLSQYAWMHAIIFHHPLASALEKQVAAAGRWDPHISFSIELFDNMRALQRDLNEQRLAELWWAIAGKREFFVEPAHNTPQALIDTVLTSADSLPLRQLCEMRCTESTQQCGVLGHSLIGGLGGLRNLTTPVETFIRQRHYQATPRARADLLTAIILKVKSNGGQNNPAFAGAGGRSCLVRLIAEHLK